MRSFKSSEWVVKHWPLASTEICILGFKVMFSVSSAKLKKKKIKAEMTHAFCRKDFIWNYKRNTHTLHEKKQDFIHSYIWYTVFNHIHTCISEAEWFLPPLPSKRLKVRDRWRALGTPCRCGPEGNKQRKPLASTPSDQLLLLKVYSCSTTCLLRRKNWKLTLPSLQTSQWRWENMMNMLHFLLIIICTHLGWW